MGNWKDEEFLGRKSFDVVLADYLQLGRVLGRPCTSGMKVMNPKKKGWIILNIAKKPCNFAANDGIPASWIFITANSYIYIHIKSRLISHKLIINHHLSII